MQNIKRGLQHIKRVPIKLKSLYNDLLVGCLIGGLSFFIKIK